MGKKWEKSGREVNSLENQGFFSHDLDFVEFMVSAMNSPDDPGWDALPGAVALAVL